MNSIARSVLQPWRILGLLILAAGLAATWIRFTQGLGASTNLTDEFPWGIWIGFDVMCGVGLAAGGFTISALVYIFRIEKWRPVARPAVLTAFIGYLLVVGGLLYDLGHPFRVWHPLIMWNHHSVMFEVGWCVTLYTIVLTGEVSALVFEGLKWDRAARIAHHFTFPLTVAAVLLSMLHQSSLGSLFLLVPGRLHELWYTPLLPFLFFISAVGIGLVMTILESNLSARAFGRCIEAEILQQVARAAAWVLGLYLVVRVLDLLNSGAWRQVLDFDRASWFFLIEITVGFVIPIVLFSQERIRRNTRWMYHGAQLAVLGFMINRLNVGITGFEVVAGYSYVPAWTEVAVSLMLVAIGVTAFNLAGRYLPVFETEAEDAERVEVWQEEQARRAALAPTEVTARTAVADGGGRIA